MQHLHVLQVLEDGHVDDAEEVVVEEELLQALHAAEGVVLDEVDVAVVEAQDRGQPVAQEGHGLQRAQVVTVQQDLRGRLRDPFRHEVQVRVGAVDAVDGQPAVADEAGALPGAHAVAVAHIEAAAHAPLPALAAVGAEELLPLGGAQRHGRGPVAAHEGGVAQQVVQVAEVRQRNDATRDPVQAPVLQPAQVAVAAERVASQEEDGLRVLGLREGDLHGVGGQ